jgi:Response regulator containing a CheY-like receiver domain and an HTH DNA-binding domain
MIDVLIVDDHPVMRELLRQVLEVYPDISIVAEASNGEDAVMQAIHLRPAVAIIDIHLPTMSGVEATKRIRLQSPSTVVIGLTAGTPDHKDMAMISAGADQVIDKVDVVCRLYAAIVDAVSRLKTAI